MQNDADDFNGKVVLITGGASGIGKATAMLVASRGAKVAICDVSDAAGQAALNEIKAQGAEAIFIKTDVTQFDDCARMTAQTVSVFGRLDAAVNNAGIYGSLGLTGNCTAQNWRNVLDVNLTGTFNCLANELKMMMEHGGSIVNMSSILGLTGGPGAAAYSASKHGVIGLTKSSALEYGRYKIRVNAVCPGFTDTNMIHGDNHDRVLERVKQQPLRRLAATNEIAEMVLWLCSSRASYVTGSAFTVDGGATAG